MNPREAGRCSRPALGRWRALRPGWSGKSSHSLAGWPFRNFLY